MTTLSGYAAPGIKETLNLNSQQLGMAISILFLTYPLAQMPATFLGKRLGPRTFIPLSLVAIAVVSMLQVFVSSYGAFVGMRALLGVVESGMFPMFKYTLSLFYGKKRYGFAIGRMMAIWQVRLRDA